MEQEEASPSFLCATPAARSPPTFFPSLILSSSASSTPLFVVDQPPQPLLCRPHVQTPHLWYPPFSFPPPPPAAPPSPTSSPAAPPPQLQGWLSSVPHPSLAPPATGIPLPPAPCFPTKLPARHAICQPPSQRAVHAHLREAAQAGAVAAGGAALRLSDVMAALEADPAPPPYTGASFVRTPPQALPAGSNVRAQLRETASQHSPRPKKSRSVREPTKKLRRPLLQGGEVVEQTREARHGARGWIGELPPGTKREAHVYMERERRREMSHAYDTLRSLLPKDKLMPDRCTILTEAMQHIQDLLGKIDELTKQKADILDTLKGSYAQMNHAKLVTNTLQQLTKEKVCGSSNNYNSIDLKNNHELNENGDHVEECDATRTIMEEASGSSSSKGGDVDDNEEDAFVDVVDVGGEGNVEENMEDVGVSVVGEDVFITVCALKKRGSWSSLLEILQQSGVHVHNVTLSSGLKSIHHCIHAKVPRGFGWNSDAFQRCLGKFVNEGQNANSSSMEHFSTISSH